MIGEAKRRGPEGRMMYAMMKHHTDVLDRFLPLVRELRPQDAAIVRVGFAELQYGTHFDDFSNFLAQVEGVKRIVLFHPLEESKLSWQSDPDHPHFRDTDMWPREEVHRRNTAFRSARALQVTLQPGDVLFIPPLWFHYVEAYRPSAAVPFWLSVNLWADGRDGRYMCPIN